MHPSLSHKAVSTWSLHRTLGNFSAPGSAIDGGKMPGPPELGSGLTLLDLIPELAARGYTMLQICHFHLASTDEGYVAQVREALADHGIRLDMLLIDAGDLSAPNTELQLAWYNHWLNVAAQLGAERARLGAGRSEPTDELLQNSGMHLAALADAHPEVRVVTENWMEMTPDAATLLTVLDAAGDNVGLLFDFGNWSAPEKYDELAKIAPRAESCHAKCAFDESGPDEADYRQCLTILKDAGFTGPIALIYDGPDDDEWAALETEWRIVQDVFAE
jgi:sugar phosphate isomerase/epimerase